MIYVAATPKLIKNGYYEYDLIGINAIIERTGGLLNRSYVNHDLRRVYNKCDCYTYSTPFGEWKDFDKDSLKKGHFK